MDTRKPSIGVSPIIATLLLIAITVAAGVIVYVFVSGTIGNLTQGGGQQTGQQIELTSYAFTPLTGTSLTCDDNSSMSAPCLTIFIKNTGGSAVTIDSIFFNGQQLTPVGSIVTTPITLTPHEDQNILIVYTGTASPIFTSGKGGYTGLPEPGLTTSISGGSSYVLKIVTSTGGLFSYTITAGSSQ